jgi:hypothetical protein
MPIRSIRNVYTFGREFLVVCPQCSQRATLNHPGSAEQPSIRLTCSNCDFEQQWQQPAYEIRLSGGWRWIELEPGGPAVGVSAPDGYGGATVFVEVALRLGTSPESAQKSDWLSLRLWYQTPCNGENL